MLATQLRKQNSQNLLVASLNHAVAVKSKSAKNDFFSKKQTGQTICSSTECSEVQSLFLQLHLCLNDRLYVSFNTGFSNNLYFNCSTSPT